MSITTKKYRIPTSARVIYNATGLGVCLWGLNGVLSRPLPEQVRDGGHFQFLTNLSLCLTIVSITFNLLGTLVSSPLLHSVDVLLMASSLVAETLVAFIYWTLKVFFVALIVPAHIPKENFIPFRLDLAIHLFPVFFLGIDYYLLRTGKLGLSFGKALAVVLLLTGGYWNLLEKLVVPPALYPYPFLNVAVEQRAIIFGVVAVLGLVFYYVYESLHDLVGRVVFGDVDKLKTL